MKQEKKSETRHRGTLFNTSMTAFVVAVLCGCTTLNEDYYLQAYDPRTDVTNYYHLTISGNIRFSRAKYSVGFYDRDAVEQLFGENAMERQFVVNQLKLFGLKTDKDLKELEATLEKATSVNDQIRKDQLLNAYAVASGLIERYRQRLDDRPDLKAQFQKAMTRADTLQGTILGDIKAGKLAEARASVTQMQVILESIRIAVDGDVLVRFFDGAGNEVDVTTKSMVIFVATDISRFAEALRQLAESEEATQNLLYTILGSRIQEADLAKSELKRAGNFDSAAAARLVDIAKPLASAPKDTADAAVRVAEATSIKDAVLKSAMVIGNSPVPFSNAEEIEIFTKGMAAQR